MTILAPDPSWTIRDPFARSVRSWQIQVRRLGILPIIGVAGSRGKSTIIRILEQIFVQAGLRVATWTNVGVELHGRRQRAELRGWSTAMERLARGTLDVAIQELDWSTVHAVGLPPESYPLIVISNVCANNEACLLTPETRAAMKALPRLMQAVHRSGGLVLNGEDYSLIDHGTKVRAQTYLAALSKDSPRVREHIGQSEVAAWVADRTLQIGNDRWQEPIIPIKQLPFALGGDASFEVFNAAAAALVGLICGLDAASVSHGLRTFHTSSQLLPGSFNLYRLGGASVVIDELAPSWFLRPVFRAINPGAHRRQVTVVGSLDKARGSDLRDLGRLVGRYSSAVVMHADDRSEANVAFRRGVAANRVPPLIIHLPTERRAITRGLKNLRQDDVVLILSDDPSAANRAVERALPSPAPADVASSGMPAAL